jgi:hypothetical protein
VLRGVEVELTPLSLEKPEATVPEPVEGEETVVGKRLAGIVLALCVGLAFVEVPAAGAARTENSAAFVGTYKVTVKSPSRGTATWTINADGSFVTSGGGFGTWSNKDTTITLRGMANGTHFRFVGRKTRAGISTRYHPGTVYVNGTPGGTWFAIKKSSQRPVTIAGKYEWSVNYDGGNPKTWGTFDVWLHRNHTGSEFYDDTIRWTRSGKTITVRRVNPNVDYAGTIYGSGFCSQTKPCTMTGSNGVSGLWFARRVRPT